MECLHLPLPIMEICLACLNLWQKHINMLDENGKPKVKPIVGCEFYVVADRHRKTFTKEEKDERYHQVLLAKNETGYKNLVKLTSLGFMEGMYSKYPRIDKELIEKYHEGLIATTCCLGRYGTANHFEKRRRRSRKRI